ncbi:MAG: FAD-dependent oxidoreductase [Ardenticatenales bacterium]|nr:FAD-dependent oxidoreductase [Ardenticatenales bacterium]
MHHPQVPPPVHHTPADTPSFPSAPSPTPPVIVLGAGVIGLTTAIRLAESGRRVEIVARAFSPHTTSDVAAAVWYPFRAGPAAAVARWALRSYAVLGALAADPATGVAIVEGREYAHDPVPGEPWHDHVNGFRLLPPGDVPPPFRHGIAFRAPVVQMPRYLGWLRERAAALGVAFRMHEVDADALAGLLAAGAAVVNCTGLGARELVGDGTLYAIRGQIVRVAPGHATHFVQATRPPQPVTYVIPRADCTVLGGSTDVGREDLAVDPAEAAAIRARCIALMPALADAAILGHAVGLRPGRDEVRLEREDVGAGVIVHCYGHGGAGVTLSWGCAEDVAALLSGVSNRPRPPIA